MTRITRAVLAALGLTFASAAVAADMVDDPLLAKLMLNEFEWQIDEPGSLGWDARAWVGYDLDKIWLKTNGERGEDGLTSASAQLLYGHALAPDWDFQVGWRRDFLPGVDDKDWLAVGLQGVAPYFLETELNAFIDAEGNAALSFETERELLFTQRLVLTPALEATAYADDDPARGYGSGLSSVEASLRLRYEIRREIAPYIGVSWQRAYGETADLQTRGGEPVEGTHWVVGVRVWF